MQTSAKLLYSAFVKIEWCLASAVLRADPVFEQLYLSHVKTLKMTGSNYFSVESLLYLMYES